MTPKDFMLRFGARWQERYKAPYAWSYGRDTKAIKTLEAYVTMSYPMGTDDVLVGMIAQFVADNDSFLIKTRHPLSELCKCPSKWFPKEETKKAISNVKKAEEIFRITYSDSEFTEKFLYYASMDPLKAAKAFLQTGPILRKIAPEHHVIALDILKDLLGPKVWEEYLTSLNASSNELINMKGHHEQSIESNEEGMEREKAGPQALAEVQNAT